MMSGETFEELLAPTLRGVRRLVNRSLRSSGHAEDVIQEVLLRAFARRDQLRVDEKFGSWLWCIALNEIRQFFRARSPDCVVGRVPQFGRARHHSFAPDEI